MKIFIPTKCHQARMRAHELVDDFYFVVNSDRDREALRHQFNDQCKILVSNIPDSITGVGRICWIRDWLYREVVAVGEWSLTIDDNVGRISRVEDEYYHEDRIRFGDYFLTAAEWREIYNHTCTKPEILQLAEELVARCEATGTIFGGLAPEDNYFYRGSHWRTRGYVKCKFAAYKNDGSSWRPFAECMFEDYVKSVDVVTRYGSVVINNFARTHNPYWEEGGIGSYEERYPHLLINAEWLKTQYPGLIVQYKDIPTHVTFGVRSEKQLLQWRKEHGYL